MDNVALLTPTHLESTVGSIALSQILPLLPPALRQYHLLLHKQLGTLSLWAYLSTSTALSLASLLTSTALLWALHATTLLALHAALIARLTLARALSASAGAAAGLWCSKSIQALRRKLFHEFALFILGCGNSVALVVFWPGWILVGASFLALRTVSG